MKIEHVREVLNGKLLAALDDESKVAVVLSEEDVEVLDEALTRYLYKYWLALDDKAQTRARSLCNGLRQLKREAFGKEHDDE